MPLLECLVRSEILPEAGVIYVAEHGRSWRQVRRVQEQCVEGIGARRRRVHRSTALEDPSGVLRIVQADQRPFVVERRSPGLNVAQEVVHPAIGSIVVGCAPGCRLREVDVLAACNV